MIALLLDLDPYQLAAAALAAGALANHLTLPVHTWVRTGPDALQETR